MGLDLVSGSQFLDFLLFGIGSPNLHILVPIGCQLKFPVGGGG
jgi:hypothetical protein